MTEDQRRIIESLPATDRGVFNKEDGIDRDPLEVAVQNALNLKNQERAAKNKSSAPPLTGKNVHFDDESLGGESSEGDDEEGEEDWEDVQDGDAMSDDIVGGKKAAKPILKNKKGGQVGTVDVEKLKPAEGVKFVEYDQYGLPKNDGFDYSKFISTDDARPDDAVFDVAPEELAANLAGHHLDVDKDPSKMTAEEK